MTDLDVAALTVPFGLVLARLGALVAACPLFVGEQVPIRVRAALVGTLALTLTATLPGMPMPPNVALAVLGELWVGLSFGVGVRLLGTAAQFAGDLIDTSVGFTFARQLDPLAGDEAGPMAHLANLLAAITFVMADGQHAVLRQLAHSLTLLPLGTTGLSAANALALVERFGEMLGLGVRLGMPIITSLLGAQLALALLARLSPALNIWAVGFLATSGLGLLATWLYVPAWLNAMGELWRAPVTWPAWGA